MRWLGVVVAATVAMGLGGCAEVVSDTPWFGPQDARGAPVLKPGLWVVSVEGCRARADRSLRRWKGCGIVLVRSHDHVVLEPDKDARLVWRQRETLLAVRDPLILQSFDREKASGAYAYRTVTPTALDAAGQVVALRFSFLFCEDFDAPQGADERRPLKPGLSWKSEGVTCVADSEAALMAAAAVGVREDKEHPREMRWVREPRPDDFAKARR